MPNHTTIRNKGLILFLTLFCINLLYSCSDEDIPEPHKKLSGCTVIVYMGADNTLSEASNDDLNEMKAALPEIPENCQVVAFQDKASYGSNSNGTNARIHHLTSKKASVWKTYSGEVNSAAVSTVKSVLQDIVHNFPSEKYALILWSHGSGWVDHPNRAIIQDNGNDPKTGARRNCWLNIGDLANILTTLPHMEYIFFDACHMQSIEVAAELYKYTSYIIASPTEIPNEGAPYDIIMKALCDADIRNIILGYTSEYSGDYGVLLSAICTEEFPAFCQATEMILPQAFNKDNMPDISDVQIYAPKILASKGGLPIPYDMRSAMHHALSQEALGQWEEQWRKTVLYPAITDKWVTSYSEWGYGSRHCNMTDAEHYGGVSMNIPDVSYDIHGWNLNFKKTAWYRLGGWKQTGW